MPNLLLNIPRQKKIIHQKINSKNQNKQKRKKLIVWTRPMQPMSGQEMFEDGLFLYAMIHVSPVTTPGWLVNH
jgi:hypothetical protein